MRKEIKKESPRGGKVVIEFDIYEGFDDIESLESRMSMIGVYEKQFMIIKFLGSYYGIINQSCDESLVMGKKYTWIKEAGIWTKVPTERCSVPFIVGRIQKIMKSNSEVLSDLNQLDKNYEILNGYKTGWRNIRDLYQYAPYMADVLCQTFYETYFTKETIASLEPYALQNMEKIHQVLKEPRIKGINPFKSEALYVTGKVHRIML